MSELVEPAVTLLAVRFTTAGEQTVGGLVICKVGNGLTAITLVALVL